jgi:hypothetical protein
MYKLFYSLCPIKDVLDLSKYVLNSVYINLRHPIWNGGTNIFVNFACFKKYVRIVLLF